MITPPTYPARPINGGPLPKALPKSGRWIYEPKVNGWRALVHCPTGAMFNRHGQPLSIASEFKSVLAPLRKSIRADGPLAWLDCEAFERRHRLGQGSLVLLDAPLLPDLYHARQQRIHDALVALGFAQSWPFLNQPPPENSLLSFAYAFTDYGIACPAHLEAPGWPLPPEGHFEGENVDGVWTGWRQLQRANEALSCELFEGLVAKRADSKYPVQLRSPTEEFPFWVKHRWAF